MALVSFLALYSPYNSTFSYQDTGQEKDSNNYIIDYNSLTKKSIHNIEINKSIQYVSLKNVQNDTIIRLEGQNIRISSSIASNLVNFHITSNITFNFILNPNIKIDFLGRFISTLLLSSTFIFTCTGDASITFPATAWMYNISNVQIDSYGRLFIFTNCSHLPISIQQKVNKQLYIDFNRRDLRINGPLYLSGEILLHSEFLDSNIYFKSFNFLGNHIKMLGNVHNVFIDYYSSGRTSVYAPSTSLEIKKAYYYGGGQIKAPTINIQELRLEFYESEYSKHIFISEDLHINTIDFVEGSEITWLYIPLAKTNKMIQDIVIKPITSNFLLVTSEIVYDQSNNTLGIILERKDEYSYRTVTITESNYSYSTTSFQFSLKELYKMYDVLTYSDERLHFDIQDDYSETIVFENLSLYCRKCQILSRSKANIIILGEYPTDEIILFNVNLLNGSTELINSLIVVLVRAVLYGNFRISCEKLIANLIPQIYIKDIVSREIYLNYKSNYTIISSNYIEFQNGFINIAKISDVIKLCRVEYGNLTQIGIPRVNIEISGKNHIKEFSKFDKLYISSGTTSIDHNVSVNNIYSCGNVNIVSDYTFDNDSSVTIYSGSIESSSLKTIPIKTLNIVNTNLSLTNVTFLPKNFVISGASDNPDHNISCQNIVINQDAHASVNSISDFCNIYFNYSIYQTGYLFVHNLTQHDKCKVKAHFINRDIRDQIFYNDLWDNFSIDLLCSEVFNVGEIKSVFASFHWNFNSSTSYFDMQVKKKSKQTCISIVLRTDKIQDDSDFSDSVTKIIIVVVCASIFVAVVVTTVVIMVLRHKKLYELERFMSDSTPLNLI